MSLNSTAVTFTIGYDTHEDGANYGTYGITGHNITTDFMGRPDKHSNIIEVYGNQKLRDRVLKLLQIYGIDE